MKSRRFKLYDVVNWLFIISAIVFFVNYMIRANQCKFGNEITIQWVLNFLCITFVVQLLKSTRLYLILQGNEFSYQELLFQYSKITIINILLPFKVGEIYRGVCIGNMIKSQLQGYVVVILDRFIDTLALISIIGIIGVIYGFRMNAIFFALTIFLVLVLFMYVVYNPLSEYWNNFLIFKKKSKRALYGLQFINMCNQTFYNTRECVNGRFVITYFLSVVAWMIELFGLLQIQTDVLEIDSYLSDVLTGKLNDYNILYILTTVMLLFIVSIIRMWGVRRDFNESIGDI